MRLIDADALKIALDDDWVTDISVSELWQIVDMQPTIDAAPTHHGRWIEDRTDIVCVVCGARYKDEIVFMPDVYVNGKRYNGLEHCPHCGAKLDGGETDGGVAKPENAG